MKLTAVISSITGIILLLSCSGLAPLKDGDGTQGWHYQIMPENPQDLSGNPEAGFNYLVTGETIGTGIPVAMFGDEFGQFEDTVLMREGLNQYVDPTVTIFKAANGVEVANGNCFSCHSYSLDGEWYFGLGNINDEYQKSKKFPALLMNILVKRKFKKDSPEREAFGNFGDYYKAIAPEIKTNNPVVNPAFRLEEACANHRNPVDLTYRDKPNHKMIRYTLAADIPPLWHVKKKHGLYYNGMGRGDYSKLLMQAVVLGIPDSTEARKVQENFDDVLAWLNNLEPPKYPHDINMELARTGQEIFEAECAKCHGYYGDNPSYPNKIVSTDFVGTDPYYARYFTRLSGLADWYNVSWFSTSLPHSTLEPVEGYVAPPLDGIWATAPYLHNGSIPTIEGVLNSSNRPAYWQTDFTLNQEDLGLNFTETKGRKGKSTYDTTKPGYSNQGHYFGDPLSYSERRAVIEYLKSM